MFKTGNPEKLYIDRHISVVSAETPDSSAISAAARHAEQLGEIVGRQIKIVMPISNEGEWPKPYIHIVDPIDEFTLKKPA